MRFFVEDRKLKRTVDVYNRGDDIHLDILVERKDNDDFDNLIPFWIIQFEYVISTNYPNFIYEKSIWRNKESSKGLYKKTIIESNYKTEQKRLKNLSHIALILRTSPEEPKNNTLFSDLRSLYDSKKQELEHQIYYKEKNEDKKPLEQKLNILKNFSPKIEKIRTGKCKEKKLYTQRKMRKHMN